MQLLAAVALGLVAVCLLYVAWRNLVRSRWPVWTGWLLWLVSGVFWVRATGAEFGIAIVLTAPALVAWVLVWSKARRREPRQRRRSQRSEAAEEAHIATVVALPGNWASIGRHVLQFLVVVPLSFAAGALVSVGLARRLPMADVNAMVLAVMLTPVLWGAAAWWASASDNKLRATIGIVMGGLLGAAASWM